MPVAQLLPLDQKLALSVFGNPLPPSSLGLLKVLALLHLFLLLLVLHPLPSPGENLLYLAFKRLARASRTGPTMLWHLIQRRVDTSKMIAIRATVAAEQLPTLLAHPAELHVLVVVVVILHTGNPVLHTVRAAPFSLRGFVQFRIQADQVVSFRAGVTEDNLTTLLTDFTEFLMVLHLHLLLTFLTLLLVLVSNLHLGLALLFLCFLLCLLNGCHIIGSHGVLCLQKHVLEFLVRVTLGLLLLLTVGDLAS